MIIVVVALLTPTCWTLPKQRYSRDGGEPRSLVGVSTNIITSSLLKGAAESNGNHVFSPIGFSSILTMISEGAEGQTLKELYDVFKFPTDRDLGKWLGKVFWNAKQATLKLTSTDPNSSPSVR